MTYEEWKLRLDIPERIIEVREPSVTLRFAEQRHHFYFLLAALVAHRMQVLATPEEACPFVPFQDISQQLWAAAAITGKPFRSMQNMAKTVYHAWRCRFAPQEDNCKFTTSRRLNAKDAEAVRSLFETRPKRAGLRSEFRFAVPSHAIQVDDPESLLELPVQLPPGTASVSDHASHDPPHAPLPGIAYPEVRPNDSGSLLPPLPPLVVGRDDALRELKERLSVLGSAGESGRTQVLTAVRGWPGVGKTTLAAASAHDSEFRAAFPDGVLWASLGPEPDLLSKLANWGCTLGIADILLTKSVNDLADRIATFLSDKRVLLIVDDVWEGRHAAAFQVGGPRCALLVTTRLESVAQSLVTSADEIYKLDVLRDEDGLELLRTLAPSVVEQHSQEALDLVRDLEGLPLALQVAGRLLNAEHKMGWGINDLVQAIRDKGILLEREAPPAGAGVLTETTPTVAALLRKSTDLLTPRTRDCFAVLGAFAPKPATFDLEAMSGVWDEENAKPIVRELVNRGLLEPVGPGRFQMHALLVAHARSLLPE
jgi:hypothetical protein